MAQNVMVVDLSLTSLGRSIGHGWCTGHAPPEAAVSHACAGDVIDDDLNLKLKH